MPAISREAILEGVDPEQVISLTQRLVRSRSVNDPAHGGTEAEAAMLVADEMRRFGWEPIIEEVRPGRPNVIAVLEGSAPGPHLIFEGHTDVVSEGDPATWRFDPFSGELVDGRILGRGAADMKAGVAAMLHAAHALERSGQLRGRLTVAALVDEEELMLGVKDFVARGHADGAAGAIVLEPEALEVCLVSKGAIRAEFRFQGTIAHGAMPRKGANAINALGAFLASVAELEYALGAAHGVHPLLGELYLTPTVVRAGERVQLNVLPSDAVVDLDIRTIPSVAHEELIAELARRAQAIAERYRTPVSYEIIDDRPAIELAPTHPIAQATIDAHAAVTGSPARLGGVPGTTDGTILARDAGVPVVVYGPGGKWIAHQANEYVEAAEVITATKVAALAAATFLASWPPKD